MIDHNYIEPHHSAIHDRLSNWARYVSVRQIAWPIQPMFRAAKTPKTLDVDAHVRIDVNTLDGHAIERAISALPALNRDALRWWYVRRWSVMRQRKMQGLTDEGLQRAVRDGRQMLINRLD